MSLALVKSESQPKTSTAALVEMAAKHLDTINRVTNVEDLRHFNMAELEEVRRNAHFAQQLLELVRKQN